MKKTFHRKLIAFLMMVVFITNSIMPLQAFASEHAQVNKSAYSLGPANFKDAIDKMAANMLVMDSYSRTILEQKEFRLTNISSINQDLKTNINSHQNEARTNATYWLDDLKPHMIGVNQDIVDYNDIFQEHYSTLMTAINQNDSIALKSGLEELHDSIQNKKEDTDKLLKEFVSFRNNMAVDTRNFNYDLDEVTSILASHDKGIPLFQQQINQYNDSIKKSNDMIIAGGILCASLIGCIAGGPMIASAKKNIDFANREIQKLKDGITESQAAVTNLTTIQDQISYLNDTINQAIYSLQNISNQWHIVGSKYNSLIENIETISPNDFVFIKEELNIAKDSWENLKEYADKLHKGTEKVEKDLHSEAS
ncbi:MAG: HBL/NHE enterotoxin family protein [Bacillota bacterium]